MKTIKSRPRTSHRKTHQTQARVPSGNGNGNGEARASIPAVSPTLSAWLAKPKQNLIDGKWVPAASGKTFEVFNPADGSVIAHAAEGDKEEINRAVTAAR